MTSVHPGGDVGGVQAVEELGVVVAAFVRDQVDLHEPGNGVVPLVPGLHRDRTFQQRPRPGHRDALTGDETGPGSGQAPVDGGR